MDLTATIHWGVSPEIFTFGALKIRWYGLLFALAFIIGYQIMTWIFKVENKNLKDLESLTITMIIATIVGARLGHCLFYDPEYYLLNPVEILKIWQGGLASHGAAIAILIGIWIFTRKRRNFTYLWVIDRIVIVVALAGFFIRTGNFFNSEMIGKPADVPWAIVFERFDNVPRHPGQLYEAVSYLVIFIFLFFMYKKQKQNIPDGLLFGLFMTLVFTARFIIEFFKINQVPFEATIPLNMGQWLSIPFIIAGIYFIYRSQKNKK